jgi:hypothetical protein
MQVPSLPTALLLCWRTLADGWTRAQWFEQLRDGVTHAQAAAPRGTAHPPPLCQTNATLSNRCVVPPHSHRQPPRDAAALPAKGRGALPARRPTAALQAPQAPPHVFITLSTRRRDPATKQAPRRPLANVFCHGWTTQSVHTQASPSVKCNAPADRQAGGAAARACEGVRKAAQAATHVLCAVNHTSGGCARPAGAHTEPACVGRPPPASALCHTQKAHQIFVVGSRTVHSATKPEAAQTPPQVRRCVLCHAPFQIPPLLVFITTASSPHTTYSTACAAAVL